ncbi:hypothetical protein ACFPM0_19380 [Pseudonocardia sulfidoxydans]|uniref:hypothetical protein n=1 Tax=Pseudonocardia sulfidoxydans TaxID=54011 RepID=UPI003616F16B
MCAIRASGRIGIESVVARIRARGEGATARACPRRRATVPGTRSRRSNRADTPRVKRPAGGV